MRKKKKEKKVNKTGMALHKYRRYLRFGKIKSSDDAASKFESTKRILLSLSSYIKFSYN